MINIEINGEKYPCYPTMGAMLRFKQETGKEITEMDSGSLSDLCAYLWCCVVSACKREKKSFTLSLMDFADNLDLSDLMHWNGAITAETERTSAPEDDGEKKRPSQP